MECAHLIILLYYWQNQNQDVEAYVPQINLGELVNNQKKLKYHFTVVIPSYFMFFTTLVGLIVPSM